MAEAKTAVAHKPIWLDLSSSDAAGSRDFYSKLFGWKIEVNPDPQYGDYGMAKVGGKDVAGIGPKMSPEAPTAWSIYIGTTDGTELARKVEGAGGKVVMQPFDVGDQGRMVVFQDPSGAFISELGSAVRRLRHGQGRWQGRGRNRSQEVTGGPDRVVHLHRHYRRHGAGQEGRGRRRQGRDAAIRRRGPGAHVRLPGPERGLHLRARIRSTAVTAWPRSVARTWPESVPRSHRRPRPRGPSTSALPTARSWPGRSRAPEARS